jgi:hypothetical protein
LTLARRGIGVGLLGSVGLIRSTVIDFEHSSQVQAWTFMAGRQQRITDEFRIVDLPCDNSRCVYPFRPYWPGRADGPLQAIAARRPAIAVNSPFTALGNSQVFKNEPERRVLVLQRADGVLETGELASALPGRPMERDRAF